VITVQSPWILARSQTESPDAALRDAEPEVTEAARVFEESIAWLGDTYDERPFFVERDVVYAVQVQVWSLIRERGLSWEVFNDYPMLPGPRRAFSADIAIRDESGQVLLAAEFKYEPDHSRPDLLAHKFPVVAFESVLKDVDRIKQFVEAGKAAIAYAVFVDEGTFFRKRPVQPGSSWIDWQTETPEGRRTSILWSHWPIR
jgi:hypothetical protein